MIGPSKVEDSALFHFTTIIIGETLFRLDYLVNRIAIVGEVRLEEVHLCYVLRV